MIRAPQFLRFARALARGLAATAASAMLATAHCQILLADQPLFGTVAVPGNLVLALSVEFPTAVTAADRGAYSTSTKYLGYFDPLKCYTYVISGTTDGNYFDPDVTTPATSTYGCSNKWSGNFLNWATMQAIDPFRWALTGGYRSIDTTSITILEKAVAGSQQGSSGNNFPHKSISSGVSGATPFSASSLNMQVLRCGKSMLFRLASSGWQNDSGCPGSTAWDGNVGTVTAGTTYALDVRVRVCKSGGLESNCVQYGSNYKPEGLIQKYAQKIRYSAFGYLNDPSPTGGSMLRDGGVLRARMKYVGPTQPVIGSAAISNLAAEWSATTGIFTPNPDALDAAASSEISLDPRSIITSSGVINYLNQFGLSAGAYKYYDPVSELYYAATRYLRNKGDVPEYSNLARFNNGTSSLANRIAMKDGFPVITNWTDPILYSCQKNFILGIGDTNSNQDKDIPGNTSYRENEPTSMPSAVSAETIDGLAATNKLGVIEGMGTGIGNTNNYNSSSNSAYMAGLAYLFHTTDIRDDLAGTQTISTYWLDVLENSDYKSGLSGRNQFYLATKYGGFTVPSNYSYANNTTALPQATWSTSGDTLPGLGARPDNYFAANQADRMVNGLTTAFSSISAASGLTTTSFSTSIPQLTSTTSASYSSSYDANNWTGEVIAARLSFDSTGNPTAGAAAWTLSGKLASQFGGTGWQSGSTGNASRRVVTWNGSRGVPFFAGTGSQMAALDLAALNTAYTATDDRAAYVNYLRGDRTNELSTSGGNYRARTKLIGDIVGSKLNAVGAPSFPFADATNPGYSAFVSAHASRRTVIYVGANDGMMHAINGALLTADTSPASGLEIDALAGTEMFAYVPQAVIRGPSGLPAVDGLASLGNPLFVHHNFVNATPVVADVDFNRTQGENGRTPDWRSLLVGGLGKGGKSFYAIDVSDPEAMVSGGESTVASKVMWEFSDADMGFSYGAPMMMKTKKYGWVVVLTSGYNNADGKGYLFFVNPKTGALLEKVGTNTGNVLLPAGLAQANAFILDGTDGTADAIYAGDLLGNLWRFDVTASTGNYPAPLKMATFTDGGLGLPQPITTRPTMAIHPATKKRYVMVGTGRLLDVTDIVSNQVQTFYTVIDGTSASFNNIPLVAPLAYPITRSMLAANTDTLSGVAINAATQLGWYRDLGLDRGTPASGTIPAVPSTGIAYRVINDATTVAGSVAWAATLPNGSACSPSGTSDIYGTDFASAKTTINNIVNGALQPVALISVTSGAVTDLRYQSVSGLGSSGGGTLVLSFGTDRGTTANANPTQLSSYTLRRLNWRELQTTN